MRLMRKSMKYFRVHAFCKEMRQLRKTMNAFLLAEFRICCQQLWKSPYPQELTSSLWGVAAASHWTRTEACPLSQTGACCAPHSSSLAAVPTKTQKHNMSALRACIYVSTAVRVWESRSGLFIVLTLSSSWFFSSSWASSCLNRSSTLPWRSSAYKLRKIIRICHNFICAMIVERSYDLPSASSSILEKDLAEKRTNCGSVCAQRNT